LCKWNHGCDSDHQIQQFHSIYSYSLRNVAGLCTLGIVSSANRWAIGEVKQVALPQQRERDTRLLPERVDEYLKGKKVIGYFAVNVIHYGYGEAGPGSAPRGREFERPANVKFATDRQIRT
jgi:hypothetical protein